jgi:hypothetical protein
MIKNFEEFEYGTAITIANRLIQIKNKIDNKLLIDIFRIKGISHFTLTEDQAAQNSFIEILKIDSSFVLDSSKTSPKILTFFNTVKTDYKRQLLEREEQTIVRVDTVFISKPNNDSLINVITKQALYRSLLLPGLGHLYVENDFKGWLLTTFSALSFGSMIYFIIETNKREENYVRSSNPAEFSSLYNKYNDAYQLRNFSILTYVVVWLYSQIDLLLFSDQLISNESNPDLQSNLIVDPSSGLQINFSINF